MAVDEVNYSGCVYLPFLQRAHVDVADPGDGINLTFAHHPQHQNVCILSSGDKTLEAPSVVREAHAQEIAYRSMPVFSELIEALSLRFRMPS